ncbi:hypothetical protein CAP51_01560 [Acinetobacter populi]|uniref:Uncharacterized protein n=2 Tax=Acinetobacter populi TaxID=1582270 RepID=A0A1Z9Z1N2_9GAMM|nr:hypothetical protein CAP51_01560 [Acinetobacter populi]
MGLVLTSYAFAETKIPMTDSYYKGKYFLLSNTKSNNLNIVVYKSVFKSETVFSKMEINCSTGKYRKIGEGIDSLSDLTLFSNKGNWISPVNGATHDDVVRFVCKRK